MTGIVPAGGMEPTGYSILEALRGRAGGGGGGGRGGGGGERSTASPIHCESAGGYRRGNSRLPGTIHM